MPHFHTRPAPRLATPAPAPKQYVCVGCLQIHEALGLHECPTCGEADDLLPLRDEGARELAHIAWRCDGWVRRRKAAELLRDLVLEDV